MTSRISLNGRFRQKPEVSIKSEELTSEVSIKSEKLITSVGNGIFGMTLRISLNPGFDKNQKFLSGLRSSPQEEMESLE